MIRTAFRRRAVLGAAIGVLVAPRLAFAAWPERAIRIVIAFPPDSATDAVARALAPPLGDLLGQRVVMENRGGDGGNLATQAVKAATDGHTLLMHSTAFAVNPTLYRNAGYVLNEFTTIAVVASAPNAFFVNPSVPATSLPELIAWMRANPGTSYAHSGTGGTPHLGAELLFRTMAGVRATPMAFDPVQAATAVEANQAPIGTTSLSPALPLIREGRLRGIAVAGARRDPRLPGLPTVSEQGFPGYEASTWFGLFVPVRAPVDAVQRLMWAVPRAMALPDMGARLAALSLSDPGLVGEAATAFVRHEAARWAAVVRASGATMD